MMRIFLANTFRFYEMEYAQFFSPMYIVRYTFIVQESSLCLLGIQGMKSNSLYQSNNHYLMYSR